jgi:hypothetical protein
MSYQQPSLISPPLSQSELEQHLWEAANLSGLFGMVDSEHSFAQCAFDVHLRREIEKGSTAGTVR